MKTLIVLGDITMDTIVQLDGHSASELHSLSSAQDITFVGHPYQRVAGTAVLFARALSDSQMRPVILGAVGDDIAGRTALASLGGRNVDTALIYLDPELPTCSPTVVYFSQSRFMVRPEFHAGKNLSAKRIEALLTDELASTTEVCFISGYAIAKQDAPVAEAARRLALWARDHGLKVIVDLIPHDFVDAVGTVQHVEEFLDGMPDVLIAERKTVAGLMRAAGELGVDADLEGGRAAAWLRQQGSAYAIVQYQLGQNRYAQDIRGPRLEQYDEISFARAELLGLGDRLAVRALRSVGLVD
jgi:sugar/nucleoside kinase (ribokinase family)